MRMKWTEKREITINTFQQVLSHTNVVFELRTKHAVKDQQKQEKIMNGVVEIITTQLPATDNNQGHIHLKGQMLFMEEWQAVAYLATPM